MPGIINEMAGLVKTISERNKLFKGQDLFYSVLFNGEEVLGE